MRKIINEPGDFVDESIDGILLAHPNDLRAVPGNRRALVRADAPRAGKVGIVTGGGSGHLPVFLGYVGFGMCDGVAIGNVFSSPSSEVIHAATCEVSGGAGVLYLYGNYGGDIYNFDLAADLAEIDGIPTRTVLAADDVASAPNEKRATRRGVAGMVYAFRIAGAAAERGDDLETVALIAQRASDAVRTMGVGLSATILPAAGEPSFVLAEGEMEIGVGIHGEPGIHRGALETADAIADRLLEAVLDDLALESGNRVSVMVNGMGATPLEELYILYRRAHEILTDRGVTVVLPLVGNFVTSLEAAGASISVIRLDDELEALLDADSSSPFFAHNSLGNDGPTATRGARPAPREDSEISGAPTSSGDVVSDQRASDDASATPTPLGSLLRVVFTALPSHATRLRDLDAALGDGDLGVTVSLGSAASVTVIDAAPGLPDAALLQRVGAAFASANPSTFAALVGGGVLFAASRLGDESVSSHASAVRFVRDAISRIASRGGASIGDKTVLDALSASADVLEMHSDAPGADVLDLMIDGVESVIAESTPRQSERGRAAWLRERSKGLQDPGMTAYLLFLKELRMALST